jgi:hypothetical protein
MEKDSFCSVGRFDFRKSRATDDAGMRGIGRCHFRWRYRLLYNVNIRLDSNFFVSVMEKLMMSHPCEHLRVEDERLTRLDVETEKW